MLWLAACEEVEQFPLDPYSPAAPDYAALALPVVTISGDITGNMTWDAAHVWEIDGVVTVRMGATLTIESGTHIKSTIQTPGEPKGVLVVARDGRIHAIGTGDAPIVMTSRYLLDGDPYTVGSSGDFGGLVILGNAPINDPGGERAVEGLPDEPAFRYGGRDENDDRGVIRYVRIEYAGFDKSLDNEVNALTLGGVGRSTTVDHIQVSYALDDGFEFFGGTVNASHLVALASRDDQFDFDSGYRGTIRYALAVADCNSGHSMNSVTGLPDAHGIELDNHADRYDAEPRTHPVLMHFTVIGTEMLGTMDPGLGHGIALRNGAALKLENSIITGYPKGMVFDENTDADGSTLTDVVVHGLRDAITWQVGEYWGRRSTFSVAAKASRLGMGQPWYNAPNSPVTLAFDGTDAIGALPERHSDWMIGWTNFIF
ncbi:hypothetical protein [Parapedobacter tibetensis]|uniref:hypothetical protein n=1 Tax=Parapedobacter tibetensis TaxID=2972951 RepID=UPI00214D9CCF|nr:hypothetical protein [Parapedobacter tibetensis]